MNLSNIFSYWDFRAKMTSGYDNATNIVANFNIPETLEC